MEETRAACKRAVTDNAPAMAPCTTFCANCMQYMLSEGLAGTLRMM